jgi:anion-transporting  ArsA/GET3 family ATPase
MSALPYRINPDDPRAPPQEVWDRMTAEEREALLASLPSELPVTKEAAPEADELIRMLERTVDQVDEHRAELERQLVEEQRLRVEEQQRREEAERRLAQALAELERLLGGRG